MKKFFSLDAIIVFIFGSLFLMIWDTTAIFNFIGFFTLCVIYFWLDYRFLQEEDSGGSQFYRFKIIALFTIIGFLLSVSLIPHIFLRAHNPNVAVHDNIEQVEPAIKFLLAGKNPYTENYFGTQLERSAYIATTQGQVFLNPALYHLIKLPFHLLFSVPFHFLFKATLGFYDERLTYLILFTVSLMALFALPKERKNKFALVAFYALNPLFFHFFVSGRDDVFVLSWLILTIYFLQREKILLSSLTLALAATSKHSAWFLVPFYYAYLYFKLAGWPVNFWAKLKILLKKTWLLPVIFLLIILPFICWDPAAFWADIYGYPAGTLATSYPINGYGASVLFYKLGLAQKLTDYLPMFILQIPLTLIFYQIFIMKQSKNNNLSCLVYGYAGAMFIYWFFSRFFHDNYIGYVAQLLLIAYFI